MCREVEQLSLGADVLVHEACRTSAMRPLIAGTVFATIFNYHADTVELGEMAAHVGVPHVVLTHLIPPPEAPGDVDHSYRISAMGATRVASLSART